MAQSLLKLVGVDWQVPDFSTVNRRQKYLSVTIEAQPTTTGLHLLVDSTGIKMLGESRWKTKKHGSDYRRQWHKVHLGMDATTLEIRAIEVTDNATGDAPILPYCSGFVDTQHPQRVLGYTNWLATQNTNYVDQRKSASLPICWRQ